MLVRHFAFLLKTVARALALLFLLAIATGFAYAQTYIFGRADFPVGPTPISVATGDLNGDGIVDLITTNISDNTISVLLGKADGTFSPKVEYTTGTYPASVAIGDFNGDGNLDLAVANENCVIITSRGLDPTLSCGAGTVSIFIGNGDGTFQPKIDYATGSGPSAVVANDFNGDGKLDLAVANVADATVSILKGNGDGTFQSQIAYVAGSSAQLQNSMVVADFNGDHNLDLAVCGNILLGNGDGTFQKPLPLGIPNTAGPPVSLAVADFNNDGKKDVAAVSLSLLTGDPTVVSIFLGNGDGTFIFQASYSEGIATFAAVASGDFNGDGKPDLAVSGTYPGSTVAVLLGNGDGTFQSGVLYGTAVSPAGLAIADFNGDGKLDLGVAGGNSVVSVVLGLGDGTFVGKMDYAAGPSWVTTADLTADGKLDLVSVGAGGVSVLLGNGNGTFLPQSIFGAGQSTASVAVGDFNNDGKPDLAAVNSTNPGSVSILIGDGLGGFQPAVNYLVGVLPLGIAVDDFNKDGNLDLAVTDFDNSLGNTVSVLMGNGDGTFQTHKDYATASGPLGVATGDFNEDGLPDMAVVTNGAVSVLLGNGDGTFKAHVDYPSPFGMVSIIAGDFNGDGRLDLAAGVTGGVAVFLGNGDGTFQPGVPYNTLVDGAGLALGDFNGDGKLDLAVGGWSSGADLLLGNGDGTFQPPIEYLLANLFLTSLAVGDFNGDGIPDWVAVDDLTNTAGVMLSTPFKAVSPAALNFGSQGVSTTSLSKAIVIGNSSNVPFNIASIAASGDFQEANNCGASLQQGTNCTVNVTFSPTTTGLESGTLTITDGTRSSPQGIPLSGTGVSGAFLTPSPSRLNFGATNVGTTSAAVTTTLINTGNASLTLTGISIAGVDAGDFSVSSNNCGSSLNAGSSCSVSVTFTPSVGGARTASLAISDSAPGSPQLVTLVGNGTAPVANLSVTSLTFASQIVDTTSASQTITLTNAGSAPLNITQISASGDFASTNTCGTSLAAGNACQIAVIFKPTAAGTRSGTVSITDNAPGSPQLASLVGNGTVPEANLSVTSLTFTSQTVGTISAAQAITLTNAGSAPLSITQISASGDFASTNTCGTSLGAGNTCQVSVTFAPTTAGARSGTVSISDDASNSPQAVTLSGTGVTASLGLGTAAGGSSSATVTVGQTASYMLSIGGQGVSGMATLSCKGAPTSANCVAPANVTVSATSASTFTVTVSTTARSIAAITPNSSPLRVWLWGIAIFGMVLLLGSARRTHLHPRLIRTLPIALLLLLSSCGGGSSGTQTKATGTPAGVYTLTVTATSGSASQSLPLTLTVQ
jgi:FG-GAP-like repeat/Cep192 domain 4/Protein of unknown function (DUF1573)